METNIKEIYIQACAEQLRATHPGPVALRITAPGDPAHYPAGTWFDSFVGAILIPAGIDLNAVPPCWIMPNGDGIPTSCAELVDLSRLASDLAQRIQDAVAPALEALIAAFQTWLDQIPPEIRQALANESDARRERHRRRYLRMMERGRQRARR